MTLSQAAVQAITSLTGETPDFLVQMGLQKPIDVPLVLSEDVRTALEALNFFSYLIFPRLEADRPEDLYQPFRSPSPAEFALLEELAPLITYDPWRARAYEQLWVYRTPRPKPEDAFVAADAYLAYTHTLLSQAEDSDSKYEASSALERALRLTAKYVTHPQGLPLYLRAQTQGRTWIADPSKEVRGRSVILCLLIDTWKVVPDGLTRADLLSLCHDLDAEHLAGGDHTWRFTLAEKREELVKTGSLQEKQASRLHFAEVKAAEGDACAHGNPVRAKLAYMEAERRFQDLNRTAEVKQMQRKGAALAPAIFAGMKPIEVEIGDYVAFCQYIAGRRLRQAQSLQSYLQLLAEHHAVQPKSSETDPPTFLYKLFGQVHFGGAGQVVNTTGTSGEAGYALDEMQSIAQLSAIMNSGLYQAACQRWSPLETDLRPLVGASSVVPQHHHELVTLGLLFALRGDFLVAASLLAPMPEEFFRSALQRTGKLAPYTDPTHVQMLTTLGSLLDPAGLHYPELVSLFGQDLMLDAKRVLDTESLNIRNTLLHGLGGDQYAADWPGRTLVQLVFRLVFGKHPGQGLLGVNQSSSQPSGSA